VFLLVCSIMVMYYLRIKQQHDLPQLKTLSNGAGIAEIFESDCMSITIRWPKKKMAETCRNVKTVYLSWNYTHPYIARLTLNKILHGVEC
jgi:hypothetical protein